MPRRRTGMLRLTILSLLVERPRHGYELMKSIEELTGGVWRPAPGALYPTLRELEAEGLVSSVAVSKGRRSRIVYSVTGKGLRYLVEKTGEIQARGASTILRYLRSQVRALEMLECPVKDVMNLRKLLGSVREKIEALIRELEDKCSQVSRGDAKTS